MKICGFSIFLIAGELKQRNIERTTKLDTDKAPTLSHASQRWKRIFLMIVAITVHNIPGKSVLNFTLFYVL